MPARLLLFLLAAGTEPPSGGLTLDYVADQVVARQTRLRRLFVEGYMTSTDRNDIQTDRVAVAFAPDRCFLDFMHRTEPDDPPWRDNARFLLWLEPDRIVLFKPFRRGVCFEPPPERRDSLMDYWESPYAQAIGWHPIAGRFENPGDQPFYLDHVFARDQRSGLVLRRRTEISDSHECVVVEATWKSRSEQLWLAPGLGFALVKRIISSHEGRNVRATCYGRDFKEAARELWLPWEVGTESHERVNGEERPLRRFRIDVRRLAVNEAVPDSLFQFNMPPGTLIHDAQENVIGFEPGGEDLLDLWGAVCSDVFPPQEPDRSFSWQVVFCAVTCALGLIVAGVLVLCILRLGPLKVAKTDS